MSYSLTAYSPYEGYKLSINGTEGRLEAETFSRRTHDTFAGAMSLIIGAAANKSIKEGRAILVKELLKDL